MIINELNGVDYYINEKEAFDKSVFNPAEYTVTLAVAAGTDLSKYITDGQQISGEYSVNGLTTNFESLVQDISIDRQFQAGYDMYTLKLSENILNVTRQSILDVVDGGTGRGELNGILKGNGLQPVEKAEPGIDYIEPLIPNTPFVAITPADSSITPPTPESLSWAIISNVLYVRIDNVNVVYSSSESNVKTLGTINFPPGISVPFQVEGVGTYRTPGWPTIRVLVQTDGKLQIAKADRGASAANLGCVLPYPLVKS